MKHVSATETKNNLASILDIARREPVTIERNGRPVVVMMAIEDYEKLFVQMIRNFQSFCDQASREALSKGLTEAKLNKILSADD